MYSASLIAAYFVNKAIENGTPVTQMKLQKMVYFAQGVNLAINGGPLIAETIEAWKYGPVVRVIYDDYKLYGNSPIIDVDLVYNFPKDQLPNISTDAIRSLDYTIKATSHLSAESLANWTHKEGSPWKEVYSPYDWAIPIPNSLIKDYFVEFLK